jgi:hypothetical protein
MLVTDFDSACLLQIDDKAGGFCLKRGNEYYLVLGTAKSYDRAMAANRKAGIALYINNHFMKKPNDCRQ